MNELQHYGVKGMKWGRTNSEDRVSLQGQSLSSTKVYQTPQWLRDNGYSLSVSDALNALKSVIPKRRSSGSDLTNVVSSAMKRVNSQGGVSVRKMNVAKVSKGQRAVSKLLKRK